MQGRKQHSGENCALCRRSGKSDHIYAHIHKNKNKHRRLSKYVKANKNNLKE